MRGAISIIGYTKGGQMKFIINQGGGGGQPLLFKNKI